MRGALGFALGERMTDYTNLPDAHIIEIERRARRRLDQTILAVANQIAGITHAHEDADRKYLERIMDERIKRGLQPSAIV